MAIRIYNVKNRSTGEEFLVRAAHRLAARATVVQNTYDVKLASQDDIVRLLSQGKQIVEQRAEAEEGNSTPNEQ